MNVVEIQDTMKTPERSRTSRVPPLYSPFAQKSFCLLWIERHTQMHYLMAHDVMTSYRGVTVVSVRTARHTHTHTHTHKQLRFYDLDR